MSSHVTVKSHCLLTLSSANSNSSHAAFWLAYYTLRDTQALYHVREALKPAMAASGEIDLDKLCASPYISALYAETLRLRSSSIIMRRVVRADLRFGRWLIPKGSIVGLTGWTTHFDESLWNTGSRTDPHPLTEFWPQRFLAYSNSHQTGPAKSRRWSTAKLPVPVVESCIPPRVADVNGPQAPSEPSATDEQISQSSFLKYPRSPPAMLTPPPSQPIFTTEGLHGIFLPYGGGQNTCPGRHFAKQEILLTVAALTSYFDIELLGAETKESYRFFGTGVLGPKGKTRFRLRRRQV